MTSGLEMDWAYSYNSAANMRFIQHQHWHQDQLHCVSQTHITVILHFMPDALPVTILPLYPGLGQAPSMLAGIPNGVVDQLHYVNQTK